jgi:hypothetical protein
VPHYLGPRISFIEVPLEDVAKPLSVVARPAQVIFPSRGPGTWQTQPPAMRSER